MPDTSIISPFVVTTWRWSYSQQRFILYTPGAATELQLILSQTFQAAIVALTAYTKYCPSNKWADHTEKILGVAIYKDQVIAAQGTAVFTGVG